MSVRVRPGTAPLRPTSNPPADSKPSSFPVTICEFDVPAGAQRASVGTRAFRCRSASPRRIVVLGDSGCRVNTTENALQACDDPAAWPFAEIAATAARLAPDLVIHVGDYLYRETACPPTFAGCRGSPWGYGWDAWHADLFVPAAPLMAAAPWIVVRGNHRDLRPRGQGWFRFSTRAVRSAALVRRSPRATAMPTIPRPTPCRSANDTQVVVFDSSQADTSL